MGFPLQYFHLANLSANVKVIHISTAKILEMVEERKVLKTAVSLKHCHAHSFN